MNALSYLSKFVFCDQTVSLGYTKILLLGSGMCFHSKMIPPNLWAIFFLTKI